MPSSASVLVVEDNETLRRLLDYRLGKLFSVRVAENGKEALRMIGERVPDLVVSADVMPVMDGHSLLSEVRSTPEWQGIPFIFLAGSTDDDSAREWLRNGADAYITKPFDLNALILKIGSTITESRERRGMTSFDLYLDPSDATPAEIAELYAALSDLQRAHGGAGLELVDGSVDAYTIEAL